MWKDGYPEEVYDKLLEEVAMGRGVKTICRDDEGMPHYTTITKRCQADPEFAEALAQAREMQAAYLFDDVVENLGRIRDGKIEAKSATAWMNGIKMIAEKLAARKYGPRSAIDHTSGGEKIKSFGDMYGVAETAADKNR